MNLLLLPLMAILLGALPDGGAAGEQAGAAGASPWYLERGVARREALPEDDVPVVADALAAVLRDGRVPGFYDGQFAATREQFDALRRLAQDRAVHPTLRIMAVMAMQEAADGEALARALEPLLIDPELEFSIEFEEARWAWQNIAPGPMDERLVREQLEADLSRHARFALAKDGQPSAVLERIAVMRQFAERHEVDILDPAIPARSTFVIWYYRQVWFDIAYHYQQFDDYEHASWWFRQLCDNLPPGSDTRMAHYNLACIAALTGRPDEAVVELEAAVRAGFLDVAWMDEDGDLASLRERPDYQQLRQLMLSGSLESGDDPEVPEGLGPPPEGPPSEKGQRP